MAQFDVIGISVSDPNKEMESTRYNASMQPVDISYTPASPVRVGAWDVPESLVATFLLKGLQGKVRTVWTAEIHIVFQNEIPLTKRVEISIRGKSPLVNVPYAERIDGFHLSHISSHLRELEALAVATVAKRWRYLESGAWEETLNSDLTIKDIHKLEEGIRKRTTYRSRNDQFLKEVARLYLEAQKLGVPTNIYIANEVGRRDSRKENKNISAETSQKWVAEARKRGFLAPATARKKSGARVVAEKKRPATRKKGK